MEKEFDEQKAVDLAKEFDAKDILQNYAEATNKLQRTLDGAMVDIRQGLRGEVPKANLYEANKFMKKTLNAAELNKYKNIKKFTAKTDFCKLDQISQENFLKKLNANKEITKKSLTDAEIDNLIKKFKKS